MGRSRSSLFFVVSCSIVVIAAIVVLALSLGRDVATYDPGTPEFAAQSYLDAVFDGDYDRAATHLDPASDCDVDDLDRAYISGDLDIRLIETVIDADRARVRISVADTTGGVIGGVFREERVLRLVRTANNWLLTGIPWPLFDCGDDEK